MLVARQHPTEDRIQIIGYTNYRVSARDDYLQHDDYEELPVRLASGTVIPIVTRHTFPIRETPGYGCVLVVEGENDPSLLPAWIPLVELGLREVPIAVFAHTTEPDRSIDYLLTRVSPDELQRMPNSVVGRPYYWAWNGRDHQIEVRPRPSERWETAEQHGYRYGFGDIELPADIFRASRDEVSMAYIQAKDWVAHAHDIIEDPPRCLQMVHRQALHRLAGMRRALYEPSYWAGDNGFFSNARGRLTHPIDRLETFFGIDMARPDSDVSAISMIQGRTADFMIVDDPARPGAHVPIDVPFYDSIRQTLQERSDRLAEQMMTAAVDGSVWTQTTAEGSRTLRAEDIVEAAATIRRSYENFPQWIQRAMPQRILRAVGGFYNPDPAASKRARELLKRFLTPEQWAEFQATQIVTERIGDTVYKLRPGGMIGVQRGAHREAWCVAPVGDIPLEDKLIGQLLHLRSDPAGLRAKANIFR